MNHQEIDREIAHLERVFAVISNNDRIPLSYWQSRLHGLARPCLMPTQRERVARLADMLRLLKEAEEAPRAKAPLRPTGTRP
ncbi:hypothetical protein [Paraburkholderia aromaticivorans]|uniref:Uncharacterized protein n=1 Tax=Paraburkholderia aromaticivorans TaxID=2026199 RepID=A0A248VNC3_9BURK|nr:hypothetical protein [Paraburkholderia aromaticivorans]ASW00534.1 hypothetical protein CJU94_19900 [Paraburkholderia aromaticivorans]